MEKFVLDVVKICRTLSKKYTINISVILKRKRDVSPIHSKKYINFIDELVDEGEIILQDNNINIFSLIRDSLLSISVPYTSTAYISSFLKKTGIYYDPFAEISPNFEKSDYVQFASNYDDLNKFVESELTKLNYL
jgi:polysaccharide biosynthesis PFTS motif protein